MSGPGTRALGPLAARPRAEGTRRPRLAARLWPAVAALVSLAVGLAIIDGLPVGVFYDDGMYVILAKSLATGHGLRWLNVPGAPVATHFPPGYPAVLAALWMIFPQFPANVLVFKIANTCFLSAAAAGCAVFAQRRFAFAPWAAGLLAIAGLIGIPTLALSTQVMSEPLFLALLFPTLLLAESVADRGVGAPRVILLGVAIGLLALVRTHAVAIGGAIGLVLLLRRRPRDAVLGALGMIVVLLPFLVWVRENAGAVPATMGGSYQPYTTWFANGLRDMGPALIGGTVAKTVHTVAVMFGIFAAPSMAPAVKTAALLVLALLFIVGGRRCWRAAPTTLLFIILYLAIVIVWPFEPARFVWGIWPLVFLLPVAGARQILARNSGSPRGSGVAERSVRLAAIAAACLIAAGYARYTIRGYRGGWWASASRATGAAARPLVLWVRANTPVDAVIASNGEPLIYLYTGRLAVPAARFEARDYLRPPTAADRANALRGILASYPVDVVGVLGSSDSLHAGADLLTRQPAAALAAFDTLPNGLVYRRATEPPVRPSHGVSFAPVNRTTSRPPD